MQDGHPPLLYIRGEYALIGASLIATSSSAAFAQAISSLSD